MNLVGNSERAAVCAPGIELNSGQFFFPFPEGNNAPEKSSGAAHHFAGLSARARRVALRCVASRRIAKIGAATPVALPTALQYPSNYTGATLCARKHSQDTRFRRRWLERSLLGNKNRDLHPFNVRQTNIARATLRLCFQYASLFRKFWEREFRLSPRQRQPNLRVDRRVCRGALSYYY